MVREENREKKGFSTAKRRSAASLVRLLSKDIGRGNGQVDVYAAVPDTQSKRSFVPRGISKVMGEHDPKLRREVRQLFH